MDVDVAEERSNHSDTMEEMQDTVDKMEDALERMQDEQREIGQQLVDIKN